MILLDLEKKNEDKYIRDRCGKITRKLTSKDTQNLNHFNAAGLNEGAS